MKLSQTDYITISVILILVFYFYIIPSFKENMTNENENNVNHKIDTNICSRSCCKHVQYPVPHMNNRRNVIDDNIGSNLMCNGGNGGGCVCLKDEDMTYLSRRGRNGFGINVL